jgi:hypothetical protein
MKSILLISALAALCFSNSAIADPSPISIDPVKVQKTEVFEEEVSTLTPVAYAVNFERNVLTLQFKELQRPVTVTDKDIVQTITNEGFRPEVVTKIALLVRNSLNQQAQQANRSSTPSADRKTTQDGGGGEKPAPGRDVVAFKETPKSKKKTDTQ